jgi:hypothetical protein
MIIPIHLSDSLALRARAEAINSSVHGALDRFVASLLATSAHTIRRSRGAIFPTVVHPLYEMRRDRSARDAGEEA